MITLNLNRDSYWLDLIDGLRLFVKPATAALIMAARVQALTAEGASRGAELLRRLAVLAILDWEGVGDETGNKLLVSEEGVLALLDLYPVAEAFERLYLLPAMLLEQEKNG